MEKIVEVVGAVIHRDSKVLCAKRGPGGSFADMWEFPGGKIEPGETPETALRREILEELLCEIDVRDLVATTTFELENGTVIRFTTFHCVLLNGEPKLTEHTEMRWLRPDELETLDWAPADTLTVQKLRRDSLKSADRARTDHPGPAARASERLTLL